MSLVIEAPPVPLRTDEHGVMRVGKTRVPLDTVVFAFNHGSSPEEIVLSYPTLDLEDVYAVVIYYLPTRGGSGLLPEPARSRRRARQKRKRETFSAGWHPGSPAGPPLTRRD